MPIETNQARIIIYFDFVLTTKLHASTKYAWSKFNSNSGGRNFVTNQKFPDFLPFY
jgi:hypothetical protein